MLAAGLPSPVYAAGDRESLVDRNRVADVMQAAARSDQVDADHLAGQVDQRAAGFLTRDHLRRRLEEAGQVLAAGRGRGTEAGQGAHVEGRPRDGAAAAQRGDGEPGALTDMPGGDLSPGRAGREV